MRIGFELEFRSSDRCDRTRYIWEDSSKHPVGCGQGITCDWCYIYSLSER